MTEELPAIVPVNCRHCGQSCDGFFRCSECDGAVICEACAREGGLFGLQALLQERAKKEKQAWLKMAEAKWQQRQAEQDLLRKRGGR